MKPTRSEQLSKLKKMVISEAKNLRKHATKKELGKLNLESLNPTSGYECVYGQMTGSCDSDRAVELFESCCSKVFSTPEFLSVSDSEKLLNSELVKPKLLQKSGFLGGSAYFSPIEIFIALPKHKAKIRKLINFLKGESKSLEL